MTNRNTILAFAIASVMAATGGAAYAAGVEIGPGGVRIVPDYGNDYGHQHYHHHLGISENDAINIARHYGVRYVESVDQYHGDYEVYGRDRRHHRLTVTIDGDNGDVIDVSRG